jgi:hypothetical protein
MMNRFACALALMATATTAVADDAARVDRFAWMSGCWGFDTDGGRYEENWTTPSGNNMLGVSRRIENGFTREFEFLRIVTSGGGGFDYIAMPKGESETRFNTASITDHSVVFDNPSHDFPNRIVYEYTAPDRLDARIEGTSNGQPMALRFPMRRRTCP